MCWVALDRALRLAEKRSFPADWRRWIEVRDQIYETVMKEGWSAKRGAFVQSYGSDALDASALLMPLVFFVSPTDPRMLQTIDAMNRPPNQGGLVSDGLVFRYDVEKTPDGLKGTEGTFNMCTFWLVDALTRVVLVPSAETKTVTATMVMIFQRMFCINSSGRLFGRHDRLLALIAADRRFRDLDPDLFGDLKLDALIAQPRHLPVDAAGRHHAVADLERVEKRRHLLLLFLHRQQDHEIEDAEDQGERDERHPRTLAVGRRHGKHVFEVPNQVQHLHEFMNRPAGGRSSGGTLA